jgi:hypothetical protein
MIVRNSLPALATSCSITRFRSDLHRRYPERAAKEAGTAEHPERLGQRSTFTRRLEKLPPEIGALLIVVGVAGILLPGPVGTPFLVAGGIAFWPSAFQKTEDWLQRVAPGLYDEGMRQMERFLADLERRYPGSTR